jgi:hypothetical protein
MVSILDCLQNYYRVISPSSVVKGKTKLTQDQLREIISKCNEGNDEQLQNAVTSIRDNMVGDDPESDQIMENIIEEIQYIQEKIQKKAADQVIE